MRNFIIYVTEEIARKVMEKGFEFTASDEYDDEETTFNIGSHPICDWVKLPTAEQICGWLRDEKGIEVLPSIHFKLVDTNGPLKQKYYCKIFITNSSNKSKRTVTKRVYKTYEEALLGGINEALNLI